MKTERRSDDRRKERHNKTEKKEIQKNGKTMKEEDIRWR